MQFKLPLFPSNTKLIYDYLGFREQDGFVYELEFRLSFLEKTRFKKMQSVCLFLLEQEHLR